MTRDVFDGDVEGGELACNPRLLVGKLGKGLLEEVCGGFMIGVDSNMSGANDVAPVVDKRFADGVLLLVGGVPLALSWRKFF